MKLVKVRSPFIIQVNETGQIGSKIELFIWNGTTIPSTPTYTFSKSIPSATQINTYYNVSNYVKEYIDNIRPYTSQEPDEFDNTEWVNFRVKRFKLDGSIYTELDSTDYIGVNGWTNYLDGRQNPTTSLLNPLMNPLIDNYYLNGAFNETGEWIGSGSIKNYNFIVDKASTSTLSIRFQNLSNSYSITYNLKNGLAGIFNFSVPLSIIMSAGDEGIQFRDGCKIIVSLIPTTGTTLTITSFTYAIDECKYTPVECSFVNRFGGWQTITFFKALTNTISVKGTEYKLTQQSIAYSSLKGQTKTMNINGKQTVKLNTGWVDENYSELITDLLLSETVLLDGKPVIVKTQSSDLKTTLKDKNINYEIDFDYSFNLINDAV